MKKVVVLLPTYNEKANIEKTIKAVLAQEKDLPGYKIELLVADSSSPDGTGELVKKLAAANSKIHFLNVGRGLGVALIEGHRYSIEHLKPDILAQLDADGQVEADVLVRMVKAIEEGYDFVQGSRFVQGGKNELALSRKLFSLGSSWVCRFIMGPWSIKEFTNSARAFTPALFKKIDLDVIPWKEQTFIIQPAFLNGAVIAGARCKEVPLVFKSRAEGYSKNRAAHYTYDMVTYAIDARLRKWGVSIPFYHLAKRSKTVQKFSVVGLSGTFVDFLVYSIFIGIFGVSPGLSKLFSGEAGTINNFTWNNLWTFRYRKTGKPIWTRFIIFNAVSFGGIFIGAAIVSLLHTKFGDGESLIGIFKISYTTWYFIATIPFVMAWNFTMNHLVTWKNQPKIQEA